MDKEKITVAGTTGKIIYSLEALKLTGTGKSYMADLRDSVGKSLSEATNVWPILFSYLPEEFLGRESAATFEETAILDTLQIYSMCMQGMNKDVSVEQEHKSMGSSLKVGRDINDSTALDRRFNAMITSDTIEEFTNHLRHIVKIVMSKYPMSINFPELANDLYWFQMGKNKEVCLRWAKDYYYNPIKSDDNTEESENE